MSAWVAGTAIVVGSVISSKGAKDAANTQAAAADRAGTASLEGLQLQLDADKESIDKQLAAQKDALTKTLDAQKLAADTGNKVAQDMLTQQLNAQKLALDDTLKLQREMFNKQVENLSSFKEAGEKGQARLMDLLGLSGNKDAPGYGSAATAFKVEGFDPNTLLENFNTQQMEQDPGYAFRLAEGQRAIERSTAARGGLQSGAALKAAAQYGQDMASQEYGNSFNRFMATKAAQSQEYGNAFNRFTTERQNLLAPLMSLTSSGQASAAGQAAAAGNLAAGGSQAIQNAGAGASAAYGGYGSMAGNIAAQQGAGSSAAYGNYGNSMSNAYAGSNATRQSAYGANTANQMNAITGAANARAAGQIGSANAFSNAISQGVGLYGMNQQNALLQQYINKMPVGSDAAIKENIRQVGVLDNGLGVYEYEYKPAYKDTWGHGRHVGVMAQEVEQIIPEAVSIHSDGYKMVNYSMIH